MTMHGWRGMRRTVATLRRALIVVAIGLWPQLTTAAALGGQRGDVRAPAPAPRAPAATPAATATATVKKYKKTIRTYPFADPNPIPAFERIYPYFRYDRYTNEPVDREWTVVELENAYLRVLVLPQIGGKIWTAIEKSTGRPFIYDNHVVKFRDIAMRGPWTSGGIEANYGIIGHTPNVATPVDYAASVSADGTARVTIGTLDLLTRTAWRLEIALPADRAYFTTRSLWQNTSGLEQPYYSWMNTGIKAAGNLEFVFPGTRYLGHAGEVGAWPIHPDNHKNLSFYDQNDFGSYKSYHVFGEHSDFWGAYWHDDDFGMARYSPRDEKLGKKIWIWGLSRQGMIWEPQLTDSDGQYVEVQSGRLFNQAAEQSSMTPFKHGGFLPFATDSWTEYLVPGERHRRVRQGQRSRRIERARPRRRNRPGLLASRTSRHHRGGVRRRHESPVSARVVQAAESVDPLARHAESPRSASGFASAATASSTPETAARPSSRARWQRPPISTGARLTGSG